MIVVGGRNTAPRKGMTRETYRVAIALWVLLWLAVAVGIGLYVFDSWWMVGLGGGIALALIWIGLNSQSVRPLTAQGLFDDDRWDTDK